MSTIVEESTDVDNNYSDEEEEWWIDVEDTCTYLRGFLLRFLCMPHIVMSLFKNCQTLEEIDTITRGNTLRCSLSLQFYRRCDAQGG